MTTTVTMQMPEPPDGYEWNGSTERWDENTSLMGGDCMRVLCHLKPAHKEPELVACISCIKEPRFTQLNIAKKWKFMEWRGRCGKLELIRCSDDDIAWINYLGHWNDGPAAQEAGQ